MRCDSRDGTRIAFTRAGAGPAVILVDGALCHREVGPNRALAERLSELCTVYTYDRRGRGESGDTAPYAVAREVEDIAALIDAAGGAANLHGISSGGALALAAARSLPGKVERVAVYEIPFVGDDLRARIPDGYAEQLESLLADNRRSAAVKLFMRGAVGFPRPLVALMPLFPGWGKNKAVAHTLPYDAAAVTAGEDVEPATERWAEVRVPALVASGGKSPAWIREASERLAQVLPNARHLSIAGQRHYVKADALAPVLNEFFAGTQAAAQGVADH